jgi:hypothetical protein
MSVIRVGSTGTYAEGWEAIFGGGKATARTKAIAPKKAAKKKAVAKKAAAPKKKPKRK